MLSGLMGALLNVKKTVYGVGEYPTYVITSAQPDAEILWSTYINGKEQEYEVVYGDYVEADGAMEIRWPDPFYKFHIGTWKREAIFLNPDGTKDRASVTFTVQATPVGPPDTSTSPPVQTPPTIPPSAVPPPSGAPAPGPITAPPRGGTVYPTNPQPLPPVTRGPYVETPPIIPIPPPDILNPQPAPSRPPVLTPVPTSPVDIPGPTGQVPPRSLYPVGQEPRPPIDRGGDVYRPVVTAPPDILNPTPLPNLPSPLPAPIPRELPTYGLPIPQPAPVPAPQAPGQDIGDALGGSVSFGGYDIPVWAIGLLALFLLKGR